MAGFAALDEGSSLFLFMEIKFEEQYKHPKWQEVRARIFKRDKFKCRLCEIDGRQLHLHHRYYKRATMVWDYPDECFITVCQQCHNYLHDVQDILNVQLSKIDPMYLECFAKSDLRKVSQILFNGELTAVREYAKKLKYDG